MSGLMYKEAWDNKLKKYVTPSEVDIVEGHDRNRYFSSKFNENDDISVDANDKENKCRVLTLRKQSKTFINKNGKEVSRQRHFSAIGVNTKDYREKTAQLIKRQESLVHKLCKEVIKDIKFIKVPEVKTNIMGVECTVLHRQYVEIHYKGEQIKDKDSGRIPDAIVIADMQGVKQELYIEFLYAHAVDERKRKEYRYFHKNCLEVDISHLRDNLAESEKSLKSKIKEIIENNCYWVSNSVDQLCKDEALRKHIIEISTKNILRESEYYTRQYSSEDTWKAKRLYLFKDNLVANYGIDKTHPCYFIGDPDVQYMQSEKCSNIGRCKNCNNCIWIENYDNLETNINNVKIYCRKDGKIGDNPVNALEVAQQVIKTAIEMSKAE